MTKHITRFSEAVRIAELAKEVALVYFNNRVELTLETKQFKDFVSEADRAVEKFIRDQLEAVFPEDKILGEEGGGDVNRSFWVVDPIDGTANFLRGSPLWGVTIAYISDGKPVIGVIVYPKLELILSALIGYGAFQNDEPFQRPQNFTGVKLLGVGEGPFISSADLGAIEQQLRDGGWGVAGYRSASVALGFAALGFTDGYIEKQTSVWDIAAGAVICKEVGMSTTYGYGLAPGEADIAVGTAEAIRLISANINLNHFPFFSTV